MTTYKITINRDKLGEGTLEYSGNLVQAKYQCWWDVDDQIPSGIYTGCSRTYLATKTNSHGNPREGIFIPNVPHRAGIFIHYWPGPGSDISIWSDGCTVVLEADLLEMWNDIIPKNGQNVTVEVLDPQSPPKFQSDMCRTGMRHW